MKNLKLQMLTGILRHILTLTGGALVAQGAISANQESIGAGIICGLCGFIWSIAHKSTVAEAIKAAEDSAGIQQ